MIDTPVAFQIETAAGSSVLCAACATERERGLPLAAVDLDRAAMLGTIECGRCGGVWSGALLGLPVWGRGARAADELMAALGEIRALSGAALQAMFAAWLCAVRRAHEDDAPALVAHVTRFRDELRRIDTEPRITLRRGFERRIEEC